MRKEMGKMGELIQSLIKQKIPLAYKRIGFYSKSVFQQNG